MPTLHVIDPGLRGPKGHNLGHHMAFWHLAEKYGISLHIYCNKSFESSLMPGKVTLSKVFDDALNVPVFENFLSYIHTSNVFVYEGLKRVDTGDFGKDDLVLLSSVTSHSAMGYGKWIREGLRGAAGRVGLWCTLTEELEDTVGRSVSRYYGAISKDTFEVLDRYITQNGEKTAIYQYLMDCIYHSDPKRFAIFYSNPLPGLNFLNVIGRFGIKSQFYRTFFSGGDTPLPARSKDRPLHIGFIGSGGLGEGEKGWHIATEVSTGLLDSEYGPSITIHCSEKFREENEKIISSIQNSHGPRFKVISGFLSHLEYCRMIASLDICVLPYGSRYTHITSGIFDDCACLGIPCVIPARSKMAEWMKLHCIDFPAFDTRNSSDVLRAAFMAVERHPFYAEEFARVRSMIHASWERNNPVAVLSGL